MIRRPLSEADRKRPIFQKWTKGENEKYAEFLEANIVEFQGGHNRRSMKFFNRMAQEL